MVPRNDLHTLETCKTTTTRCLTHYYSSDISDCASLAHRISTTSLYDRSDDLAHPRGRRLLDLPKVFRLGVAVVVELVERNHLGLEPQLVAKVCDEEEGDGKIAADEVGGRPSTLEEDRPCVEDADDGTKDESVPAEERLEPCAVVGKS